jgi:hypothetical protein
MGLKKPPERRLLARLPTIYAADPKEKNYVALGSFACGFCFFPGFKWSWLRSHC